MKSWLADARELSQLSPEDCASALGCSRNTYMSREKKPGGLTLIEVSALGKAFNEEGRKVMRGALRELTP